MARLWPQLDYMPVDIQEYALMGSQQRQHLVALMALPELIVQVVEAVSYQSNSEHSVLDFQPPLSLLGILFRRYT